MEFVEGLLRHGIHFRSGGHGHDPVAPHRLGRSNLGNIASHELDARLLEIPAGLVLHRDPTDDIDHVPLLGRNEVVARLPGQPAGEVAQLGLGFRCSAGLDFPLQTRLEDGVVPERWELRLAGKAKLDLPVHLNHGLGGPAGRAVAGAEDFRLNRAVRLLLLAHEEVNRLPLKKREKVGLGERVVAVVLLEDLQRLSRFISQNDGIRFEFQRRAVVADFIHPFAQFEGNRIADHREILIVNGQPRRSECHGGEKSEKDERGWIHNTIEWTRFLAAIPA